MFENMKRGMSRTREHFNERMNILLDRGPDVDDGFWDGLEEALILSDVGAQTAVDIVDGMREDATRHALPDAYAVMDALVDRIADAFTVPDHCLLDESPVAVLFVGINGAGKTTTVGKIASEAKARGREVLLGSADTFRAAAVEQLEVWAKRAGVEIVERKRGSDPASVCFDTIERAEQADSNLILIDTAGRLHTSDDLMRELKKVVDVTRKRASMPVRTVLVLDATTGQNGLNQAREFNKALTLDGLVVTKLDGTAKGGIALAVSHELGLPIVKIGVGENIEDLQDFDAHDYAAALIGAEPDEATDDETSIDSSDSETSSVDTACESLPNEEDETSSDDELDYANDIDEQAESVDARDDIQTEAINASDAIDEAAEDDAGDHEEVEEATDNDAADSTVGRFKRLFRWHGREGR